MDSMSIEERLEFIEYRQQLLFDNTPISRILFEYDVSEKQNQTLMGIFEDYRQKIESGESVHHGTYEQEVYEAVPQNDGNYHFAEIIAKTLHEDGRWTEVFETLYGEMPKFQSYLNQL